VRRRPQRRSGRTERPRLVAETVVDGITTQLWAAEAGREIAFIERSISDRGPAVDETATSGCAQDEDMALLGDLGIPTGGNAGVATLSGRATEDAAEVRLTFEAGASTTTTANDGWFIWADAVDKLADNQFKGLVRIEALDQDGDVIATNDHP
jgi:hypothetical protein